MREQLSLVTRRELVDALRKRYQEACIAKRTVILNEFVEVTGYHRKHAIRVLGRKALLNEQKTPRRKSRIYDEAVGEALIVLWEAADRICGKRLKALIPLLLETMERHGHLQLDASVREHLLKISAATIDRMLVEARERVPGTRRRRGVGATLLRRSIPIRTFGDWNDPEPGYMEADLVAHCGGSMAGSVVHTLVLTDIATGWTECVALVARDQSLIVEAIERTRKRLPFRLRGFDTDNDCAFINQTVLDYCRRTELEFTRSRAYRKNDQAWVEQKNGAIVRKLAGYDRLSGVGGAEKLAKLYEFSRLYVNCFQPSFKLKSKTRTGARVSKRYHAPVTPYDRVMAAPSIPETMKEHLRVLFHQLDPIELIKGIRCVQAKLNAMATLQPAPSEPQSSEAFVRELRIAWQEGEVRPTHRRRKAAVRHWRTRADPFEQVWKRLLEQLDLTPDITAKDLFHQLQAEHPGRFPTCQLRTLQRRVKHWRSEMARSLIMSASEIELAEPELLLTSPRA